MARILVEQALLLLLVALLPQEGIDAESAGARIAAILLIMMKMIRSSSAQLDSYMVATIIGDSLVGAVDHGAGGAAMLGVIMGIIVFVWIGV